MAEKVSLTPEDWDEIRQVADEIMQGYAARSPAEFRRHVEGVLAARLTAAMQAYEDQEAAELIHKWEFGEHPISRCAPDWCGRYRGQRRDSQPTHPADECHLVNCVWHPSAPPAPAGPAASCQRCARSGVGVCDDYPDCPAGRAQPGYGVRSRWAQPPE